MSTYAHSAPARANSTPATSGSSVLFAFCDIVCRPVAFSRWRSSTSPPMIARRVGVMNTITEPWKTPMTMTCHQSSTPIATPTAVMPANTAISPAATMRMFRIETLSASAPANGDRTSDGALFAAMTMPSTMGARSARSYARSGRASIVACIAPK